MNIYAGTYNGQIYMVSGHPTNIQLRRRNQISQTSIRCLYLPPTSSELLSGGFDGQLVAINKYNLQSTKQTKEPKGIINCIERVSQNVVAVGLETGLIRFWEWKSWSLKKQLREHKKPVRGFCIDKNDVLFFSAANNGLILWNTQKYEKVFHYKFDYEIEHVLLDETLQYSLLINPMQVHQIKTENNEQVAILKMTPAEVIQSAIMFQNFIIIGGDKGNVFIYPLGNFEHKITFEAHKLRVKCMKIVNIDDMDFLITASSSGEISVWDVLQFLKEIDNIGQDYNLEGLQPLSSVSLDRRVICIEVALIQKVDSVKKVQKTNEPQESQQKQKSDLATVKVEKSGKKLPVNKENLQNKKEQKKESLDELKRKKIEKKKRLLQKKKLNKQSKKSDK